MRYLGNVSAALGAMNTGIIGEQKGHQKMDRATKEESIQIKYCLFAFCIEFRSLTVLKGSVKNLPHATEV